MATMGERLQHMREQRRMTQMELSEVSGVRRATISDLESSKQHGLTVASAKGLARALGVSLDWLVGTWDEEEEVEDRPARAASQTGTMRSRRHSSAPVS